MRIGCDTSIGARCKLPVYACVSPRRRPRVACVCEGGDVRTHAYKRVGRAFIRKFPNMEARKQRIGCQVG